MMGAAGRWSVLEKSLQFQFNHLNYASMIKASFLIGFDQKCCACIAWGLQRKFLVASDFIVNTSNLFYFFLSSKP